MRIPLRVLIAWFFIASSAAYAGVKNVAVVETELDAGSGAAAKMNRAEVRQITAELRGVAVNSLPGGKYNIMTAETVQSQLGSAKLGECADENCVITLGSAIGADYIVRGIISKLGTNLTLSVEMYETNDGNLVGSSGLVRAVNTTELLDKAATACAEMYRRFEAKQGSPPKSAPPVAYTVTVSANPANGGVVSRSPDKTSYSAGERITITAIANGGYSFTGWSGSVTGAANPGEITVNGNMAVGANFYLEPVYQAPPPPLPPVPYHAPAQNYQQAGGAGKTYRTVRIGNKTWMGENLNIKTDGSWCYDNKESNCDKYGRLYTWMAAKAACPSGWHLPSRADWDDLGKAVGGKRKPDRNGNIDWYGAGKKLKARSGWKIGGNGTDEYGFTALPGGYRRSDGSFGYAGGLGFWWTATEFGGGYAYGRYMYYVDGDDVDEGYGVVSGGFSVRCVGD
ncbi:MAG: hypothetical protein LBB74_03465 [Chitinispirillales bacterium]|nr:hypothetical protein [Chitinispirillales bacterium]